ncbi:MAG: damage-inducible protein [Rhodospirillaceae bacterium]|nr:damage-inducible protein [Rhodospirillaceae bacterium]
MSNLTNMGAAVGELLKERNETVAVSESSSGGLVSAALLAIPGASAYFMGGGVVYTHRARETLLKINFDDHPGVRSSSEPYAELAAATIRDRLGANWGLAESGAAGPTGNRYGDAAGHTCIAVAGPIKRVLTLETGLENRDRNMWLFAEKTLATIEEALRAAG